ncbi:VapE domain-containing protein [Pontibacter sp. MBLB2868]|uniref:VapE domain-containing protein n=1 Tax=Pontibacter sp. MBLB2868 TaxID=3451555 RepID=UPI003F750883
MKIMENQSDIFNALFKSSLDGRLDKYLNLDNGSTNDIELIERFLKRNYYFRYNTVKGQLEILKDEQDNFRPLTERDENSLWREIQKDKWLEDKGVKCSITYLRGLLASEFSELHDPFKEYFESLPKWNSKTDYIAQLASTVKTNNDELFHRLLKSWLVAIVGSLLDPKVVNHTAIIFTGKQGIGKSSWIQKLVPPQLKDYYYSGPVNPFNKDTLINLSTCMIIDLDELESMSNTEVGAFKELITKPHIKIRRPYGRYNEDLPRRASFAGSINDAQFLNDSTGSRRFLVFEALGIDYKHKVDMDWVYSQALALYQSGFKYWLNEDDIKELEVNNSRFQRTTVEEDMLLQHFQPAKEGEEGCLFYSATEVARQLSNIAQGFTLSNATTQRLGKAMRKNGFKTLKKGGLLKYCIRHIGKPTDNKEPSFDNVA